MKLARWISLSTLALAAAIALTGCAAPKTRERSKVAAAVPAVAPAPTTTSAQVGKQSASPFSGAAPSAAETCKLTTACPEQTPTAAGGFGKVSASELASILKARDFSLVNVHTPYAGEIEGTDVLLPYDQIQQNLGKLPADRNAKIVLYCRSGAMSAIAAGTLVKLGYSNIWSLEGGTVAWQKAGYPLLTKGH